MFKNEIISLYKYLYSVIDWSKCCSCLGVKSFGSCHLTCFNISADTLIP